MPQRATTPTTTRHASPRADAPVTSRGVRRSQRFAPDADSVRAARVFVTSAVPPDHPRVPDLALATSELATNAVLHASTDFEVSVARVPDGRGAVIRVEVTDAAGDLPRMIDAEPTAPSGRGMHIVDGVVDRWGTVPTAGGKAVWFEIDWFEVDEQR